MDIGNALRKKYGESFYGNNAPRLTRLSTGYIGLDYILGGGLPIGRMVQLAAAPSVGKSTTCLCIAKRLLEREMPVVYIDLERTCDEVRLSYLGIQGDPNWFYLRPEDGEEALNSAVDAAELGARLVVIDSVPNLIPSSVMESDIGKQAYSPVARFLGNEYPKLVSAFERSQSCLVFINQVRDNVGSLYGGKSHPGGYALKHALSISIDLSRIAEAKDGASYTLLFKTSKNKTYREKLVTELTYYKDLEEPICKYSSLIMEGVRAGLIIQSGAYYKLPPEVLKATGSTKETLGQGKEKAQLALAENKDIYDYLYQKILETYGLTNNN